MMTQNPDPFFSINPSKKDAGVALFDFDGTLIPWDSQWFFRYVVCRRKPFRRLLFIVFLLMLPIVAWFGKGIMKRVFLCFLWKSEPEAIQAYSKDVADLMLTYLYPEMREAITYHKEQGDFIILSSASPQCYIEIIGSRLGFDLSLGTQWELPESATRMPLFPNLTNHKGVEKVTRLRKLLPQAYFKADGKLIGSHGYSDSSADLPMLALCDEVTLVNPDSKLSDYANQTNWRIIRPKRPWNHRFQKWIQILRFF
jgi:HAD superfamily phosphoserine phosphatase-like hydrolase